MLIAAVAISTAAVVIAVVEIVVYAFCLIVVSSNVYVTVSGLS